MDYGVYPRKEFVIYDLDNTSLNKSKKCTSWEIKKAVISLRRQIINKY